MTCIYQSIIIIEFCQRDYEKLLKQDEPNNETEAPNGAKSFQIIVRSLPNYSQTLELGIGSNVVVYFNPYLQYPFQPN